jgi:hypothetical protein
VRQWWVNQNQTYRHEVPGGYLWSPVTRSDGVRNYFYDTMRLVEPGDLIYSFCDTYIKAVGIVSHGAEPSIKPDFGAAGGNWSNYGWLVQVEFQELETPFRPKDHMHLLGPHLPPKYSPLRANGDGLQGVYLTELPAELATELRLLVGPQFTLSSEELILEDSRESAVETALELLLAQPDVSETERVQLTRARVGQGLFRNNVRLHEHSCRVTGVRQPHHLRASHIKPWRASDNHERLHGCNGLLLAPHIDHLFDRGYISFADDGDLVVSEAMEPEVLAAWSVAVPRAVGSFNVDQRFFLDYHRTRVFQAT